MSAVSASIFGPISSTKSSKSTLPPPVTHWGETLGPALIEMLTLVKILFCLVVFFYSHSWFWILEVSFTKVFFNDNVIFFPPRFMFLNFLFLYFPVSVNICALFYFLLCYVLLYSQLFCSALSYVSEVHSLTDLLAQFNELHLGWHVAHGPHTLPEVFVADVAFFVPVELHKCLPELWQKQTMKRMSVFVCLSDDVVMFWGW